MLKPVVDEALADGNSPVEKVLVVERNNEDLEWIAGRDYSYNELIKNKSPECPAEPMDSEDPLFLQEVQVSQKVCSITRQDISFGHR